MKKILIPLLLLAVFAFTALPDTATAQSTLIDGAGGAWRSVMTTHLLRDAALSAGDSLHRSDLGFGRFIDISYRQIDSVALMIRVTDSLSRSRLIIERPGIGGGIDTVGVEIDSIPTDVNKTLVIPWFVLNKAMGGVGMLPAGIDFHLMLRSAGTTYAGAPQVTSETFDMWMKEYRKE
jgi:hypothetical protein